jgi:hypothetical protein
MDIGCTVRYIKNNTNLQEALKDASFSFGINRGQPSKAKPPEPQTRTAILIVSFLTE